MHVSIIDRLLWVSLPGKTYEGDNPTSVTVAFTREDVAAMEREWQAHEDAKSRLADAAQAFEDAYTEETHA